MAKSSLQLESRKILERLSAELVADRFKDEASATELEHLKVIARSPDQAPSVYQKDGVSILVRCAFGNGRERRPKSSLGAAKVLANALLLKPDLRRPFGDLYDHAALVTFYAQSDAEHEFVGGRILFLLTYDQSLNFDDLIKKSSLFQILQQHLQTHAVSQLDSLQPMEKMALIETLKLAYNLASNQSEHMNSMSELINSLLALLNHLRPSEKLEPPNAQVLNALAIIDWPDVNSAGAIPKVALIKTAGCVVGLLQECITAYPPSQLETSLVSLLTVCRKLVASDEASSREILQRELLPSFEDREKPLGQSDSLASNLLRLQTSAGLVNLPEAIGGLLFDLSERDATKFIHNIGYGHAAGFLATHQIPIPQDMHTTANDSSKGDTVAINPITGQLLDAEMEIKEPEMTREEKEREAERLFVLFERLKATGVVDVENPVTKAMQEGRFEELSDSDPD